MDWLRFAQIRSVSGVAHTNAFVVRARAVPHDQDDVGPVTLTMQRVWQHPIEAKSGLKLISSLKTRCSQATQVRFSTTTTVSARVTGVERILKSSPR